MTILRQKRTLFVIVAITIAVTLSTQIFATTFSNTAFAHSGKLINVNGKDYWIWVATKPDPAYLDTISGAEAYIYTADPQDPLNGDSNQTKPVEGMDAMLKIDVIAGDKNKTFALQQVWNDTDAETGHYESPFVHTVETTYDYRLFGDWNGTQFDVTWSCTPGEVPESPQTNETTTLSNGVIQKAESGGFSCPKPLSEISFPEQYLSNVDIQAKLNGTG